MVYQALSAGRIDYARAWTISKALELLPDDTARAIAGSLLDEAERLTPSKLKARLLLRAVKADPSLLTQQGEDPFKEANQMAKDYGLKECG